MDHIGPSKLFKGKVTFSIPKLRVIGKSLLINPVLMNEVKQLMMIGLIICILYIHIIVMSLK